MKGEDKPVVHIPTLRRDLYFVMSLLLADKEVSKLPNAVDWTQDFYETEVSKLLLWVAVAVRGLLDLSKKPEGTRAMENQICGEYWPNFISDKNPKILTLRQACNSIIHAKEIMTYKIPGKEFDDEATRVYDDRITVKSTRGTGKTHAQLDIVRFVRIAYTLSDSFEENNHANK